MQNANSSELEVVLRQINTCWKVEEELDAALHLASAARCAQLRPSSSSTASLLPTVLSPLRAVIALLAVVARVAVSVLAMPLPSSLSFLSSYPVSRPRLRDVSTLASQLSFRLLTALHWPSLYRSSQLPPSPSAAYHASSLLLYSSVVQSLVDILLGVLLAHLLRTHSSSVLSLFHDFAQLLHSDVIRANVQWFQQQPVGLKLNTQLSAKLGQLVVLALTVYDGGTAVVARHEEVLLEAASWAGLLGASTLLAVGSDALSVLTLHVDLLHTWFSLLYRALLSLLSSLFRLFRGKKRNRLRGRIDTLAPGTPQLLLGVLLFAVIFFLAPTVVVYYAFFSLVRLLVMGAQAVLWWGMAACNCFPVLPLAVWATRRGALPGGVRVEALSQHGTLQTVEDDGPDDEELEEAEAQARVKEEIAAASRSSAYRTRYCHVLERAWTRTTRETEERVGRVRGTDYLVLVSSSVPVRSLFFQYRVALSYLQRHYTARNLAAALFQGKRLPTAPAASSGLAAASLLSEAGDDSSSTSSDSYR